VKLNRFFQFLSAMFAIALVFTFTGANALANEVTFCGEAISIETNYPSFTKAEVGLQYKDAKTGNDKLMCNSQYGKQQVGGEWHANCGQGVVKKLPTGCYNLLGYVKTEGPYTGGWKCMGVKKATPQAFQASQASESPGLWQYEWYNEDLEELQYADVTINASLIKEPTISEKCIPYSGD